MFADIGVDGLKTGFIKAAGYGLVASAKRDDQRLILVVTGLDTTNEREPEPRRLLEWGFKSFKPFRLFDDGQKVSDALVWGGKKHYVPLVGNSDIDVILPVGSTAKLPPRSSITVRSRRRSARATKSRCSGLPPTDHQATNDIPLYAAEESAEQFRHARSRLASRPCLWLAPLAWRHAARTSGEPGKFITFEGGEGAGKSTQAAILVTRLKRAGREVLPPASPAARRRRKKSARRCSRARPAVRAASPRPCFLVARADHVERVIGEALAQGKWVVCDRFSNSTRAYQGARPACRRG